MMKGPSRAQIQSWLIRLADGDRSAFDPLFRALWPLLQRFARRLLSQDADAEDAAQQALLEVFRHAGRFDRQRDALPWIFGIVAYECKTRRRQLSRRREEPRPHDELATLGPAAEAAAPVRLEHEALIAAAREVLGTLSAQDVETLLIATGDGERPPVAGATFRKRLQRARQRLRAAWRMRHGAL